MTTKRTLVAAAVLAAIGFGIGAPASAHHAGKRCSVGVHNDVQPLSVVGDAPEPVPDVDVGLGQGRVQVGVACDSSHGRK